MTAIDHHSMIGDSHCANSAHATVKCACAVAVVAAAVVASVGLQMDRCLGHVAIFSMLLESQSVHCDSQYLKHQLHNFASRKVCFIPLLFRTIRIVDKINLSFFISSAKIVFI